MQILRNAGARGHVHSDWLDSRHTFSFGHYHDPQWMGFGPLRVLNEDRVAPGGGFPRHGHANMEILSYVLNGALAHRDSTFEVAAGKERMPKTGMSKTGTLQAGDVQWMSAGSGIEHSEYNASQTQALHFLQIWIQPDRLNLPPARAQASFDPAARRGRWATLASPDGTDGSLSIRQQAWLRSVQLAQDEAIAILPEPGRRYWLHLAQGSLVAGERELHAGDALGLVDEIGELGLTGTGSELADVLLFDLPD